MKHRWTITSQLLVLGGVAAVLGVGFAFKPQLGTAFAKLNDAIDFGTGSSSKRTEAGRKGGRGDGQRAVPVIVAKVESVANDETVSAIGSARARRSVMLYPKVDGEIVSVSVQAGQLVAAGDEILRIDPARAELSVRLAQKTLDDAKVKLERAQFLQNRAVSSGASVADAAIAVERAEIELEQAREILRETRLVAPFAGHVGIPKLEAGERVTTSSPIVTLDDRSELYVEFEVPEAFIPRISIGDLVVGTTPGFGQRTFEGRLGAIDTRIDPTTRSVMVRAVFDNADDRLRPGMSFSVALELPGRAYPAVPELALQYSNGKSFVWVTEDDEARRVDVETVRRMNSTILVDGPIKAGDLVVVEGVQRLRPGSTVSYGETFEKSEPAAPAASRSNAAPGAGRG